MGNIKIVMITNVHINCDVVLWLVSGGMVSSFLSASWRVIGTKCQHS